MNTCPVSTLKVHSTESNYTPNLMANGRWQLRSAAGHVLVGFRGNAYNFASEKTARNWLCSNLGRFKNATANTNVDHIIKLHRIYAETQSVEVLNELQAINDYEQGLWVVVECNEVSEAQDTDGGNAFTED